MAYTTINKSTDYFNTKKYSGNGSTNAQTGIGFQPDWVLLKSTSHAWDMESYDALRGATKVLSPKTNNAESTDSNSLTSFDTDGFTLGSRGGINYSSNDYVSWNWKANGAGSSNTDGSITSTVSANQTAGFSIVSYSGTGTLGTVGHGLGVTPEMIIVRKRNTSENWLVYQKSTGNAGGMLLNSNSAYFADNMWNSTSPTSSVFTVNAVDGVNGSGGTYIAYCFASKTGYSKISTYIGNGANNGPFVYTGFKPSWVMIKSSSNIEGWWIVDTVRSTYNLVDRFLRVDSSNAELVANATINLDIYSNGFKLKDGTDPAINGSSATYTYMAFGQSLVGSNNVPCTAR